MRECITNDGFCVKNEENYCPSDICELEIENKQQEINKKASSIGVFVARFFYAI